MTETKAYLFHELSSYLPLLEGEEFDDLVEDIRQHGQIEPATIYEGKILDGRNRYRACQILKKELMVKEWKPSIATGSTPLQYVISENIMRRHLNEAQKGQIGMILYPEIEDQVKEEQRKKQSETLKEKFGKGEFVSTGKGYEVIVSKEIITPKKDDWTSTAEQVAQKVRVKPATIRKVKKITDVAKTDKSIAEKWEDVKRGDSSISAVYKEIHKKEAIEKLPEDLKTIVKKEESKVKEAKKKGIVIEPVITIKEAKVIAEIPSKELRKKEVAERVLVKKRQEAEVKKKVDIAEGKIAPKEKFFDKDANKLDNVKNTCKKVMEELTFEGLEGYDDFTRKECIRMMKILFEHLKKELRKAGEVVPDKVIDVGAI